MRHPNIVGLLDVGVEGSVPYIVMELLRGGDLRALLADVRILTLEHALAFLLPIASGLGHAHDLGIIHRDLKPANVFLARDVRDDVVPTLVDFGLSKVTLRGASSSHTESELVAGTALYMAPEQTLGVKNASPASDQYSLAAILYEAVTGQPPFEPDSVHVLLERIRTDAIRPASQINGALPEAFSDALMRAMNREPLRRYPSVRAFGAALLPFASLDTVALVERDFGERTSGKARVDSRPSLKKALATAETRLESKPLPAARPIASSAGDPDAPLPCAPGTSPFHIKGMPYRGLLRMVEKQVPGGLDAFCDALSDPRLREFLHQPFLATSRYDVFPFIPIFAALGRLAGLSFEDIVCRATIDQCRYDAKTVFKMMFSTDKVGNIVDYFPRFNAQYYDFGTYRASLAGPQRIVLELSEIPAYIFPWIGPMHVAYAAEAARIVGAREIQTTSTAVEPMMKTPKSKPGYSLVKSRSEISWAM